MKTLLVVLGIVVPVVIVLGLLVWKIICRTMTMEDALRDEEQDDI